MKDKINIIKSSGVFLLTFLFILFVITMAFFYIGISINIFNFYLSLIITIIINRHQENFHKILILSLIVLLVSILTMSFIYDRSSDGNTYHKDAVGNLYLGWNPVKENVNHFINKKLKIKNYDMHTYDIWKQHYTKANWILEADIYKITNNIESGKALNLICMYILFTFAIFLFNKKLNTQKAIILSTLITFNPITSNQLFTFYNDQLGASLLFILIINLINIITNKNNKENFTILFMLITLLVNIKFNIMGYAMVFSLLFMIYYLIKNKKTLKLPKLISYWLILFIFSFVIMGYPTYVKNYLNNGNIFYPIYGENKEDIITAQEPKSFIKKNTIDKFFIATFSKVNNLQKSQNYQLKIPFTFSKEEIKESMAIDTRISGYGILFSGLFIISIIILIFYLIKNPKSNEKNIIKIILLASISIIIGISESWWARYNPTTYLILISALYILFKQNNKKLNYLFLTLIIINTSIILLGNSYYSIKESYKINKDLNKLKNKSININFNYHPTGILYNLNDKHIKYTYINQKLPNITYYKYLTYKKIQ
jgi:hypothetical protein